MPNQPTAVVIIDATDKKSLVLSCGCAVALRPSGYTDSGMSWYFCADHSHGDEGAIVYDADLTKLEDPFGWDYKVWPGIPTTA